MRSNRRVVITVTAIFQIQCVATTAAIDGDGVENVFHRAARSGTVAVNRNRVVAGSAIDGNRRRTTDVTVDVDGRASGVRGAEC